MNSFLKFRNLILKVTKDIKKYIKQKEVYISSNLSSNIPQNILAFLQSNENKKMLINSLNKIANLNLKDISFKDIEKFKGIEEYEFYLLNLIGTKENNLKEEIFIKKIKKGKIKESLFCICDLVYEKYFTNDNFEKDYFNRKSKKKISILEEKNHVRYINKVSVHLFEDNLDKEKVNIEIYFIEISRIAKKNKEGGRNENIELSNADILIVGVEKNIDFL